MKKIFSKTGFSLIELIVALTLVTIIITGIISINLVLSNNGQDYGQRYLVKSETQTTLNHILNNASLAIGSGTTISGFLDQAIIIGVSGAPTNTFCFHQGGTADAPAYTNITSSATDIWLCYTSFNSAYAASPNEIYYCTMPINYALPNRGAGVCVAAANPNIVSGPTFLGTANGVATTLTSVNGTNVLSLWITNCFNNALASCTIGAGTSTDPANNPATEVSGSVTPPQAGTG